jgi:hypothetical protein
VIEFRLIEFDFIPLHLHLGKYPMPILYLAALLVGISIADSKIKASKKGADSKPDSGKDGGDKKGDDEKGDDTKKSDGDGKSLSLNDLKGSVTLYVSTTKPGGDKS